MLIDRIVAVLSFVGSIALIVFSWTTYDYEAALFPIVVLIIMVVCSVVLFLATLKSAGGVTYPAAEELAVNSGEPPSNTRTTFRTILILLACTAAIPWVGFYATCFVILAVTPIMTGDRWPTAAEVVKDIIYAVICTVAVYVIFGVWLDIAPPEGWLI